MELTNKVKEYREQRGEGLRALAGEIGMTAGHLSKLERGLAGCGAETKRKLARHFGVDVPTLFFDLDISYEEMAEATR